MSYFGNPMLENKTIHYMAVGTGGGGQGGNCPPNILPTQKIQDYKNNDI